MRALLAVAVLAASCTARSKRTDWERLKSRTMEGVVPTNDDVEFMLNRIEDVPAARSDVLSVMMIYHARKEGPWDGQLSSSYYTDDPLLSRLYEVETFESLLDMAVSERNRCERAKACDEAFLDLTVNFFSTILMMYTAGPGVPADLNSLITSRADDIITLSQHAADRSRGTEEHTHMSMQADLLRSLLTGNYEEFQDQILHHAPRAREEAAMAEAAMARQEAERAHARDDDWVRLLTHLEEGKQFRTNDVDLLFEVLEDSPDERGLIAAAMRSYYVGTSQKDLLIEDPLFTRLVEPATFERLLQMASFEHKKCARANALYELNCEKFRVELAGLFGLLIGGERFLRNGEDLAFRAVVKSHTKDIIALLDRAAEFASGTTLYDARAILKQAKLTRTTLANPPSPERDAAYFPAEEESWTRVKEKAGQGKELTVDDVQLIATTLERGHFEEVADAAAVMTTAIKRAQQLPQERSSLLVTWGPLQNWLQHESMLEWLLETTKQVHFKCLILKDNDQDSFQYYQPSCESFDVQMASFFVTWVIQAEHVIRNDPIDSVHDHPPSAFSALLRSHATNLIAVAQRQAEFASASNVKEKASKDEAIMRALLLGSQDDLQNVLKVFWNTPYAKEFENTHGLSYEDPTHKRHDLTSLISLVVGFAAFFVVLAFLDLRIRGESFAARAERFRRGRALADAQLPVWGNLFRVAMCFRMFQINLVNYKDVYNLFGDFVHLLRML